MMNLKDLMGIFERREILEIFLGFEFLRLWLTGNVQLTFAKVKVNVKFITFSVRNHEFC